METTTPKRGRPVKPADLRVKMRSVRLDDRRYQIFKLCGRDKWMRAKLDEEVQNGNVNLNISAV